MELTYWTGTLFVARQTRSWAALLTSEVNVAFNDFAFHVAAEGSNVTTKVRGQGCSRQLEARVELTACVGRWLTSTLFSPCWRLRCLTVCLASSVVAKEGQDANKVLFGWRVSQRGVTFTHDVHHRPQVLLQLTPPLFHKLSFLHTHTYTHSISQDIFNTQIKTRYIVLVYGALSQDSFFG